MSYPKEPNYYALDIPVRRRIRNVDEYRTLFSHAPKGAICGEASPWYLFSYQAVPAILKDNPRARFIACLRNPVDMFVSLHGQELFNQEADEKPDPEEAWARQASLQPLREGDKVTSLLPNYRDVCSLGRQAERLLSRVGRERTHFVLFDDIEKDPRSVYEATLKFLGLESDGRTDFVVHNRRKAHRFPALSRFLMRPPPPFDRVKSVLIRAILSVNPRPGNIYELGLLSKSRPQAVLRPEFRNELGAHFSDQISLLERLTGRDLSAWRAKPAVTSCSYNFS